MPVLSSNKAERFAQNLVKGLSQRKAYYDAYPSSKSYKPDVVDVKACELAHKPEVEARVKELQDQIVTASIMDAQERMELLTSIAECGGENTRSRLQAIDLLNKMDGIYVKKVEANVSTPIPEVVEKVAEILNDE